MATRSFSTRYPNARRRARNRPLARLEAAEAATGRSTASTRDSPPLLCARGGARGRFWRLLLTLALVAPRAGDRLLRGHLPARRRHRGFRRGCVRVRRGCVCFEAFVMLRESCVARCGGGGVSGPPPRRTVDDDDAKLLGRDETSVCVIDVKRFLRRRASRPATTTDSLTVPSASASSNVASMYALQPPHLRASSEFSILQRLRLRPDRFLPRRLLPSPPRRSPREIRRHPGLDPRLPHHSLHHRRAQPQPLLYRPMRTHGTRVSSTGAGGVVGPVSAGARSPTGCPTVSDGVRVRRRADRPAKRLERAFGSREKIGRPRRVSVFDALEGVRQSLRRVGDDGGGPPEAKNAASLGDGAASRTRRDTASRALDGSPTASAKSFGTDSTWARPSRCASRHLFASDARATRDSRLRWSSSSGMTTDGEEGRVSTFARWSRRGLRVSAPVAAFACAMAPQKAEGARGVDAESPKRRRTRRTRRRP